MLRPSFQRYLLLCLGLMAIVFVIPACAYYWISTSTRAYLYSDINALPSRPVALVLGTAKYTRGGQQNLFYRNRIAAALALYRSGKVQYFIVSGSNPSKTYNEPADMQADLIAGGVPAENIQPDYAGLRTLDSILRVEKVFGNTRYIIVSQPFHNARAVFIAHHNGHDAVAFNAANVTINYSLKTRIREVGARLKAISDLFLTNKQAKHYGDKIIFPPQT